MERRTLILNVDDDHGDRERKTAVLSEAGFQVVEAETGTDALARVEADGPQIVLLSVHLQDIDGYEVCRRIRSRPDTEWMGVVHIANQSETTGDWRKSVEAGANSYLTHPLDALTLLRTVQVQLARLAAERAAQIEHDRLRGQREGQASLYSSVLDQSLAGVYVIQDRRFTFVNEALCTILGSTAEELLAGASIVDLVHPDDRTKVAESFRQRETGDVLSLRQTFRVCRKDGGWIVLETHGSHSVFDGRSAITGLAIDQTRRAELEDELRQAQKMEAIGQLAGGIAHDFNNLLTAILGYSSMALEQIDEDKPLYKDLLEVEKAANSAAALTRKLLAFGRRQRLRLEVIDLNAAIGGAVGLLQRLLDEPVTLELRLAPTVYPITADPIQVEQILMNLVLNARDAMPAGGEVTVTTANCDLKVALPSLPAMKPGEYAQLIVGDTGTGMTAETRARLFEPFFTTKQPGKGTGLGLATVYSTVKQLEGYVTVDSEPGAGATFSVYLPRAGQESGSVAARARPAIAVGNETILLVEDEPAVLRLAETVLRRHGYKVVTATTPEAALQQFQRSDRPDFGIMISDVVMPGMTGAELTRRLRDAGVSTPVLLMSGYAEAAREALASLPGIAFLPKPFLPQVLLQTVRDILDRQPVQ